MAAASRGQTSGGSAPRARPGRARGAGVILAVAVAVVLALLACGLAPAATGAVAASPQRHAAGAPLPTLRGGDPPPPRRASRGPRLMTVQPLDDAASRHPRATAGSVAGAPSAVSLHPGYMDEPAQDAVPESPRPVRIQNSFLGLSLEYWELPKVDRAQAAFDRLVKLLRVRGGGPVVLRIGGDSADTTAAAIPGQAPPPWATTIVDARWLRQTARTLSDTGMKAILDLNALDHDPTLAAALARDAERAFPRGSIQAFEIGNEPNLYQTELGMPAPHGTATTAVLDDYYAWGSATDFTATSYLTEWRAYARAIRRVAPHVPLAGPATSDPAFIGWARTLASAPDSRLGALTSHLYTMSACEPDHRSPRYPGTYTSFLAPYANAQVTSALEPFVRLAHRHGLPAILTEANSATCGGGRRATSYATALWAADALFDMADAGLDQVHIHVRMSRHNAAFTVRGSEIAARPLMYGLAFFARALAPGATIVPLRVANGPTANPGAVHVWLLSANGRDRMVVVNDDPRTETVLVKVGDEGALSSELLRGGGPGRGLGRQGATLAGQRISRQGRWVGARRLATVGYDAAAHGYELRVPGFAASLSLPRS